jgi:hypothetical protein
MMRPGVPTTTCAPFSSEARWPRSATAAAQSDHLDVFLGARQAADFHGDLVSQLARGAQHHGLHRKPARVELGQQRQRKGGRLSAAGLGLGNQVLARQGDGQAGGLDGGHGRITQLLQVRQCGGREGKRGESCHAAIIGLGVAGRLVGRPVCYYYDS